MQAFENGYNAAIHGDLLDDIIYCGKRLEHADEFLGKIFVGSYGGEDMVSTQW